MSEMERRHTKKVSKPTSKAATPAKSKSVQLPPQNGPADTRNWDSKLYKTPDGRRIFETDQTKKDVEISE